jgi:hypothetical protein
MTMGEAKRRKRYRDLHQLPGDPDSAFSVGESQKLADQINIVIHAHFSSQGPRHHRGAAVEALASLSSIVAAYIEFFPDDERLRLEHFFQTSLDTCRKKHDWANDLNIGLFDLVSRGDVTCSREGLYKLTEKGKVAGAAQKPAQRTADLSDNAK